MKKAKKFKKRIKVIEGDDVYRGEKSPYWDFMAERRSGNEDGIVNEDVFANPDVLSEDDHMYHRPLSARGEQQFQVIREAIKDLTPQQQKVLQLCGFDGMSQKDAAKELNISEPRVTEILERVRVIIRDKYKQIKSE